MKEYFSKINNMNILSSIIFIIISLVLIFNPEGTLKIISYLIGALFIVMGCIKIFNYFKDKKNENTYFKDDLVYGILYILIGIFALVATGLMASIFRIIIALWIMYTGILRLIYTFRFKVYGDNMWVLNMILSIAILACGAFILFNNGIIIVTMGVVMLCYSIIDLIEAFIFAKNIKLLN